MTTPRRTPLHAAQQQCHARFMDFHGWELPVQYRGIIAEHLAVRSDAGLFDVSHMGELWVEGAGAAAALQGLLTNDLGRLQVGGVQYTLLCNEAGGTIDDLTVLRPADSAYLLCVNAANTAVDWAWLREHLPEGVAARDASEETALLALQGPRAEALLQPLVAADLTRLRRFHCLETGALGIATLLSRTGYTGEDGFELFLPADSAVLVWDALLETGVRPCGLGARDTLRIEAGFPLHGHELDPRTSPIEAGLKRFVSFDCGPFIGRAALARQAAEGAPRRRIGLRLASRAVARTGYAILRQGLPVGQVTSGAFSPTLQSSIAMGYVESRVAAAGNELAVEIRGKPILAQARPLPFYHAPRA
ncbi:MAG: glycine cleavage system aminomethyltransferase GcvT [Candidatus Tectomicrobia bacterium]|nr:glycine cleavage system aminomethyltransferase GcvT [Candidatus Tectomicrobia bacterium]